MAGTETVSLIEILGLDGLNDFVTVPNASQSPAVIERVAPIPFTSIPFMLVGIGSLPPNKGGLLVQEANPFGGDSLIEICTPLCSQYQSTPVPTPDGMGFGLQSIPQV